MTQDGLPDGSSIAAKFAGSLAAGSTVCWKADGLQFRAAGTESLSIFLKTITNVFDILSLIFIASGFLCSYKYNPSMRIAEILQKDSDLLYFTQRSRSFS